ncbi:hypothetical protein [Paenibacillus thalictri]|uniref:hypothetical protein n=1 Tax=Paenibacillus thalictri TaxID=2527873 RepID=UPI0013EF4E1A|nr:hypothetical protein [Paenibacillus thalictri]
MSEIMLEKRQRSLLSPNFTCRKQAHSRISGTIGDRKHDSLMQLSLFQWPPIERSVFFAKHQTFTLPLAG